MRTTARRGALLTALSLSLLVAACGDDDGDDDAGSATTTEAPAADDETTTTTVAADDGDGEALAVQLADYSFVGLPEEIEGGAVRIAVENTGQVDHEIAFVSLGDGVEGEQFFADFAPVVTEGGAWPEYARTAVGAVEAEPGRTEEYTFTLPEGRYMAFCALQGDAANPESEEGGAPHFERGMQQIVTVTGGEAEATLPDAEGTVTASDYTFEVDIPAGATTINFVNDGPNPHFAGIDRYPEGTTPEQAEEAFRTLVQLGEGQEPPAGTPQGEEFFFSGVASAGMGIQATSRSAFEPGTYVAYCFLSDYAGGPPHAIGMDMVVGFTVE